MTLRIEKIAFVAALALAFAAPAAAQEFPTQPIRILVGFAPGGIADVLARTVGEKLSQTWKQPVIVENRTGAGGNIAIQAVAKAAPDGYTLVLIPNGNATVSPSLFPDLPYDPVKDFAPISNLASVENVLVVSAKSPIKSLQELIAFGRDAKNNVTYATPAVGSMAHLSAELLARAGGFKASNVGYRGTAPALTDVMRGEVTMMVGQLLSVKPLIESGELRALGIASRTRSAALPDVPTIAETFPGFEAISWYALMAPAGTPPAIIEKLYGAVAQGMKQPDAVAALEKQGATPVASSPGELAALITADIARWRTVIVDANIKPAP